MPNLTARDEAAVDVSGAMTLNAARTDDPLSGVTVPVAPAAETKIDTTVPSHLQQVHAELVSQLPVPDAQNGLHHTMPALKTSKDYSDYIRSRTEAWKEARKQGKVHPA